MVLPGTLSVSLTLLILSILCFSLWPNIFKLLAGKWRFELFSIDFALGGLLTALLAAYTLGTLGSDLNFSDSMLVAGRRAQAMSVAAGTIFALGNLLYLATIALLGMANGTLLTFCVFGCGVSLLHLAHGRLVTSLAASFLLAVGALLAILSAQAKRAASAPRPASGPARPAGVRTNASAKQKSFAASTKGSITGLLAGLTFAGVSPVFGLAQTDELGIGAYGGILLATVGILVATLFLNFFFLNISLEGGTASYSAYFAGAFKSHLTAGLGGFIWTAGALALFAASTGAMSVPAAQSWAAPFAGALLAITTGLLFWQKSPQPPAARRNTLLATILFIAGIGTLLSGFWK